MTVSVHGAPHPDALIALVCDQLAIPVDAPFVPEPISDVVYISDRQLRGGLIE